MFLKKALNKCPVCQKNFTKALFDGSSIRFLHKEIPSCIMETSAVLGWLDKQIYYRNGRAYRKLDRNETIKEGAMHSWCHGELNPIQDPSTIGDIPANFSDQRDFYNPIEE